MNRALTVTGNIMLLYLAHECTGCKYSQSNAGFKQQRADMYASQSTESALTVNLIRSPGGMATADRRKLALRSQWRKQTSRLRSGAGRSELRRIGSHWPDSGPAAVTPAHRPAMGRPAGTGGGGVVDQARVPEWSQWTRGALHTYAYACKYVCSSMRM